MWGFQGLNCQVLNPNQNQTSQDPCSCISRCRQSTQQVLKNTPWQPLQWVPHGVRERAAKQLLPLQRGSETTSIQPFLSSLWLQKVRYFSETTSCFGQRLEFDQNCPLLLAGGRNRRIMIVTSMATLGATQTVIIGSFKTWNGRRPVANTAKLHLDYCFYCVWYCISFNIVCEIVCDISQDLYHCNMFEVLHSSISCIQYIQYGI